MKKIIPAFLLFAAALFSSKAEAQSKKIKEVEAAAEQLRLAMISGDSTALANIADDSLQYGHSGGHIDSKQDFVHTIASGHSDFVSIEIMHQTIQVKGKVAFVRHMLNAVTNDNNKPGTVKLSVLLVFIKEKGGWKLAARQAVKPS